MLAALTKLRRIMLPSARTAARDQSGGVAVLFAGAGMMLALVVTGAIEYQRRTQSLVQLQNAVDSATLSTKRQEVLGKKTMSASAARTQAEKVGKNTFDRIVADAKLFTKTPPSISFKWATNGALTGTASTNFDLIFWQLLPSNFSNIAAKATVDFSSSTPTEIALVLDTTASMFNKDSRPETRFTLMRNAAKGFTHQLFDAAQAAGDVNLVRVSVVPWATSVNVLGNAPAAADFAGSASVSSIADKGSQIAVASPMNRSARVNYANYDFRPVDWRGCISGATEPATYTDAGGMNWNALIVPAAPQVLLKFYEGAATSTPVNDCTCTLTQNVPCGPPAPGTQGFHRLLERAVPQISNTAMLMDRNLRKQGGPAVDQVQCTTCVTQSCTVVNKMLPSCGTTPTRQIPYCTYYSENGRRNSYNPDAFACTSVWEGCFETGTAPTASENAPACVADPNEPKAINNTVPWCAQYYLPESKDWAGLNSGGSVPGIAGPNLNCPMPMLGLSGNRKQVIEYIDRMSPVPGGTHTDVGLRWGLRTLSPNGNWPGFFGLTKNPAAFKTDAQKVMVMITDGANEQAIDFPGYWGCNDTTRPGCSGSPDPATLDDKMYKWCEAIRLTYGINLYIIAVNFTDTAAVDKLKSCAGNAGNVFSVDASALTSVLEGIAARVMSLRLTQ